MVGILILVGSIGISRGPFIDVETSTDNVLRTITYWYDLAWHYRKPINITNSYGSNLSNYQVKVTMNTTELIAAGKMQADGDDIRFTSQDKMTSIPYWIESGINTTSTVLWVKVPSVPTGNSTVYIYYNNYYNNPNATSNSSVANTFSSGSFSDTFSDSSKVNLTGSVNITVTSGEVRLSQALQGSNWVQTSQGDFEAGVLNQVDTSSSPGNVTLAVTSSWFNTSWSRRAPITINNTGSALSDYQVKVDVTYDSDMQPDFDDIRFTAGNGVTSLSYWRESYTASTSAVFWVNVTSIPAGDSTIYMYYGNPSTSSASSVSATFISASFSDTFADSSKINTTDSFSISVTDGHVEIDTHTNETTLTATGDARVVKQDPNAVHGSETHLALQQYISGHCQRGFIQFDITSIPQNVIVNDVDFNIYYYAYLAGNPAGQNTRAKGVIGAWTESTITWNNQPGNTTSGEVSLNMPGSYGWVNYDADAIVQSWLNGSSTNYGFLVKFNTEYPTPNRCPIFYSKDYGNDSYRPKLKINWTEHETTAGLSSVLIPNDTSIRLAVGNQLSWNDSEPVNTDVEYQIEYKVDGSWELIPDSVLAGNSAGFDTSPVDISSVMTDYSQIRLKASLSTTDVSTTPTVDDWIVTYHYRKYADPEPGASVEAEESTYAPSGTLASQVYDVGISRTSWSELSWNETLPNSTDITFEVRASDTSFNKTDATPNWTDLGSANSPVDLTPYNITGGYFQWRANLSTGAWDTPVLHDVTASYAYYSYNASGIVRSVLVPQDTATRFAVGGNLSWNDTEPASTDIKYQLEYYDGGWQLVSDGDLPGNSAGFDASPVDISSMNTTYGQIRLRGNLSTSDDQVTPSVQDWQATYYYREYVSPEPTTTVGAEE